MLRPKLLPILSLLLLAATPLVGQSSISGSISDDQSGFPIDGATVVLLDAEGERVAAALSDEEGRFILEAPDGVTYSLAVNRVGYQPIRVDGVRIASDSQAAITVRMGVDAVPIDPVVVVAEQDQVPIWIRRFRERAENLERSGRGEVVTRVELEEHPAMFAYQLVQNRLFRRRCQPAILLDGLPVDQSFTAVRVEDIEGVEIYDQPSQIPFEYFRPEMCGAVLFWTRTDGPGRGPLTWRRVGISAAVMAVLGGVTVLF